MQSRLRLFGHPIHPMLVDFPVAIFPLLVAADAAHRLLGENALWVVGGYLAAAGGLMAALAILTGLLDLAALPNGTRAHRVAVWHLGVGLLVLALYAAAVWARWPLGSSGPGGLAVAIDVAGSVSRGFASGLPGRAIGRREPAHVDVVLRRLARRGGYV
jgi:hypothetical protein